MLLGYCRVSTQDQAADNRTSLEEQERIIRGIAMVRGVDKMDVSIYCDPGISGGVPLRFRPEGKKLLNEMNAGDIVVASKLDRMFRSASDALSCAERMKEAGVSLILVDMGADPVTGSGMAKCFFTMAAAFAELERSIIHERMTNGKAAKKARGGHIGGEAPYGQRLVGHGRDARLEIDEHEQEIVNLIMRLRKRGTTVRAIRIRLVKDGHKTRSGKDFQDIQVARVIAYAKKNAKEQEQQAA
jgi:DNA invertase Pin-like site-specific DNA recombinase